MSFFEFSLPYYAWITSPLSYFCSALEQDMISLKNWSSRVPGLCNICSNALYSSLIVQAVGSHAADAANRVTSSAIEN